MAVLIDDIFIYCSLGFVFCKGTRKACASELSAENVRKRKKFVKMNDGEEQKQEQGKV